MAAEQSPHQIPGIPVGGTEKEIRKAYRRLAMKYHPDRNPNDPEAEEKFEEVQWSYETLSGRGRMMENHQIPTYQWGFGDPFPDLSHPFFSFYMAVREHFSEDRWEQASSKKNRGRRRKR